MRLFRRSSHPAGGMRLGLALAALLAVSACAARPDPTDAEAVAEFRANNDRFEPLNRGLFFVNDGIDTLILRPAAEAYRILLPPEVRLAVRNVLGNLRTPVILVNDLLQGETQRAAATAGRFVVNSTLGIGGIFDAATSWGLLGHTEDFGQTFAVWGLAEGPFLFLPVLGPSNPRDLVGAGLGILVDPLTWVGGNEPITVLVNGRTVVGALDTRESLIETLDAVRSGSLDPYATIRSGYRQRRDAEIRNVDTAPTAARGTGYGVGTGIDGPPR